MNERFTLDSTVTEISENERVNKKLPIFFDLALCSQIKWPFSKMKLKNDEDDEGPGTGVGGCRQFYSGET